MTKANFMYRTLVAMVVLVGSPAFAGPLQDAIEAGNIERVQLEIARGADIDEPDLIFGLPLMIAAQGNRIAIAEILVANGADVDGWDISGTALHAAARAGHTEMVEFLIGAGADLDATPDGVRTPLHQASENGKTNTMELLILYGARIDGKVAATSALHLAAGAGHADAVRVLMTNGADIEHQNDERATPLHRSINGGHVAITELLLDAGADIEARGTLSNITPLELARMWKRAAIIELLIQRGATQ